MALEMSEIRGAVARGWCYPDTEHLTMDPVLAERIAFEILSLLVNRELEAIDRGG